MCYSTALRKQKEQIEQIRNWWKENGAWVAGGLVLGLSMLVGWNSWQSYVANRAEEASSLYEQVRAEAVAGNADRAFVIGHEFNRVVRRIEEHDDW